MFRARLPVLGGLFWKTFLGEVGFPCKISLRASFQGKLKNIRIGAYSDIMPHACLASDANATITLGGHCEIHPYARLLTYGGNITLGDHCSVNPYTILYGHGGLEIGSRVRIAAHVVIIPANHGIERLDQPIMSQEVENLPVRIHDNVWVGTGARILAGVVIGPGAVVAAGAVVTKNVPENGVVAGVPARLLFKRGEQPIDATMLAGGR
jgi:acetyltransferase-like isoleucine patch superfamily enzyme